MDMVTLLQAEIVKAKDNLQTIEFNLNDQHFTFYYRYLTLLQKVRIEQLSTSAYTVVNTDGTSTTTHEKKDYLIPIHTILECSLDEDGKKLFSGSNPEHFKLISSFPAALSSYIAYEQSLDVFGSMTPKKDT